MIGDPKGATMKLGHIAFAFAYGAIALGAEPVKQGGFVPSISAAPPALTFSVPYSFASVDPKLQSAVIRCVAKPGVKAPPIAAGETTVVLNGQPKSDVATVKVSPLPGQTLAAAKFYTCAMRLSDGKITDMPPGFNPNTPLKWTVAKTGSTLEVSGEIK
jgi:hypothetical protein